MDSNIINKYVIDQIPRHAKRILDLGCSTGAIGKIIKDLWDCHITGITIDENEAAVAKTVLDCVIVRDLNEDTFIPEELGRFECVLCSHILEHLHHPEQLLKKLLPCFDKGGYLVVALPNVLYWKQRIRFLIGKFQYTKSGILDRTHYRFFTWKTAKDLLNSSGYSIVTAQPVGFFPLSRLLFRPLQNMLDRFSVRTFPGLFCWQFVFRCQPSFKLETSLSLMDRI